MEISPSSLLGMVRSGLNLITQAISIHDQDLRLVHGNKPYQEMFQLPDTALAPGADFRETLLIVARKGEYGPLEDVEAFVDEKVALARQFEPHYFERTRANGTSISVEGSPLDEGGWITVYTDITEIKRQERFIRSHAESLSEELVQRSEDLAQSNRELSATIRALEATKLELTESRERISLINRMIPAHIAHVDATGRYTHSNGNLGKILPSSPPNMVGHTMADALGPEIWPQVEPSFRSAMSGKSTVSEVRDDQTGHFIRLAMSSDIREDGTIAGAYILSSDVTDEVSARTALAHARRRELATQLTSAMAHDFSNLLTIIMGQQARLDQAAGGDETVADISETIKSAARRGAELIDSLNRISPERIIEPSNVNMSDFIARFEPLARAALPETMDVTITNDLPEDTLTFDPGFAQDALLNLVINAAEASEGQGQVRIKVHKSRDGRLEFLARDHGPGFSEEALKNALSPFFSTKGGKVGRGLGLTSAYDFAKSCGGHLRIWNHAEGGAVVSLKVPYITGMSVETGLVLLVDDDDEVRNTVRGYLRQSGHAVIEAASVDEAHQLLSVDGISLVVTDLSIGTGGTGLDVAQKVPPSVPVLIITGLGASDALRQKAEQRHPVLNKPFDIDRLNQAIGQIGQ